jgi:hypothetical protein
LRTVHSDWPSGRHPEEIAQAFLVEQMTNRCGVCRQRWQSEVSDGIIDQPIATGPSVC